MEIVNWKPRHAQAQQGKSTRRPSDRRTRVIDWAASAPAPAVDVDWIRLRRVSFHPAVCSFCLFLSFFPLAAVLIFFSSLPYLSFSFEANF